MPLHTVYLEAPERTQDLLNIKWTLRSAGYTIGSSWHDGEAAASLSALRDHWNSASVEQMQKCDSLVVICGNGDRSLPELAMMAGFALARGMSVYWVGCPVKGLSDFHAVQRFNTAEEFGKYILQRMSSESFTLNTRLAA